MTSSFFLSLPFSLSLPFLHSPLFRTPLKPHIAQEKNENDDGDVCFYTLLEGPKP